MMKTIKTKPQRDEVQQQSAEVIQLFKDKHDVQLSPLEIMVKLRLSNLSLPAMLALSIVNSNHSGKYPLVYVGEVEGFFMSYYKRGGNRWSYSAIARMLNKLVNLGYLDKERHGRFMAYGMTSKGIRLVRNLGLDLTK
tara:strand:- start:11 stop:424 length:414 start_codon:yes stop_codon:yes gene_type:complete